MSPPELRLRVVVSQMFAENAYIAHLDARKDCLVVDPGLDPDPIVQYLDQQALTPAILLNTHGHVDHIAGNQAIKDRWPDCPLVIGAGDADKLLDPQGNLSGLFGMGLVSPPADQTLEEGDQVEAAGFKLDVLDTPGHSSGHIVFVWKQREPYLVFGGDVLFRASIGRTDFPDGDPKALIQSIQNKLFPLPDDTEVLPGHGQATTIGHEKQFNPYVRVSGS